MKRINLLCTLKAVAFVVVTALSCMMAQGVKAQTATTGDGAWKLVWHDEFDGNGPVDEAEWNYERGFVRNEEYQWYQPQNAYKLDGILVIEGRLDSIPNPRYEEGSRDWKRNRPFARYSAASINTRGKFTFRFGRMEVRARIPAVCGSWPAIWTLGESMPWPSNGEIDIMEYYQVNGQPTILANAAWGTDHRFHAKWDTQRVPYTHFLDKDPFWGERFHIWRMDWDEQFIRLYLDDELLNEVDLSQTINGEVGNHTNPFHQPHYILLNLAIGGQNGGTPVADAFPMRYEIDWVRVFEKK